MRLAFLRQLHSYVGAFIAPSVLFFALTGGLQLFGLHEAHGDYAPPALIEKLGKVHKDQVFEAAGKRPHAEPAAAKPAEPAHADADHDHDHHDQDHEHGPKLGTLLLKWLFLAVAAGLATSTLLGLWMAIAHNRRKGVIWALLVAGAVLPVVLLLV
jgi:hypothetical protein